MEAQEMSSQEQDTLAGQVMDSLGASESGDESQESAGEGHQTENQSDPLFVQKRLKQQKRVHEREIRDLHARMADLQTRMAPQPSYEQATNPYSAQGQPVGVDEQIHKAVSFALNHRDMEERKAKEMQNQVEMQKQYKDLYKHLDSMGDKYDDFHDTVFGDEAQFTPTMRDYSLTLPKTGKGSAGEVLYNLGKNPSELERISKLSTARQAQELALLSHALIGSADTKSSQPRPLGTIKSNPVTNSHAITDKTPVGSIRQRMKAGSWK